jgi:hypothetical protein
MNENNFDVAVIGSSPLLMMYALHAKAHGRSVLLVNDGPQLGGAWSIDTHLFEGKRLEHENACHLVEWYKDGYELLERMSGVRFAPLHPQPVKIHADGKVELYTSASGILRSYLWQWIALALTVFKVIKAVIQGDNEKRALCLNDLSILMESIRIETRYRVLGLARFDGIYGPEGGFVRFVQHLVSRLDQEGIRVLSARVDGLQVTPDGAIHLDLDGARLSAAQVIVGESVDLTYPGVIKTEYTRYFHVLVSLPSQNVLKRNSYVHYPDDPTIHRVTYVEDVTDHKGEQVAIFLIQLRRPLEEIGNFHAHFEYIQGAYRIVTDVTGMEVQKIISATHVARRSGSAWREFQGRSPVVIRTIGDISRNAILMRKKFLQQTGMSGWMRSMSSGPIRRKA